LDFAFIDETDDIYNCTWGAAIDKVLFICELAFTDIKDDLSFIYMNIGQNIQGGGNQQSVIYLYFVD